jgi:beta-xylosidase
MEDWWIWSSPDLINWKHECTLFPKDIHVGPGFKVCFATDAAEKNGKYYWYFSEGNYTGVVVADTPVGPWRDPLKKPLVGKGIIPVNPYDPGILIDDDGTPYLIFGVYDYYIARLNDDMISLAEKPRKVIVNSPEGPYGIGKTDDKSFLHKRNGIYYLSWGCFYGMSKNVYGPYDCKGSILKEENVDPELRYTDKALPIESWRKVAGEDAPVEIYKERAITFDRHGSFFEWHNQWYFICNEMTATKNPFYRDSSICYVNYKKNGEIEPVKLEIEGVRLPEK